MENWIVTIWVVIFSKLYSNLRRATLKKTLLYVLLHIYDESNLLAKVSSIRLKWNADDSIVITFWAMRLATMSLAWTSIVHIVMIFCLSPELSSPNSMPINELSWEIWRREEKQIQSNTEENRLVNLNSHMRLNWQQSHIKLLANSLSHFHAEQHTQSVYECGSCGEKNTVEH